MYLTGREGDSRVHDWFTLHWRFIGLEEKVRPIILRLAHTPAHNCEAVTLCFAIVTKLFEAERERERGREREMGRERERERDEKRREGASKQRAEERKRNRQRGRVKSRNVSGLVLYLVKSRCVADNVRECPFLGLWATITWTPL